MNIQEFALKENITLSGIAEIDRSKMSIPDSIKNLNYAISLGYRLSKSVLDTLTDGPNELYYFHYQRVNILLDMVALKLTNIIQHEGHNAIPVPASQIVDWSVPGGRGLISHKKIAELAQLGWRGKNNLVVNPQYGSQVRYVTVLTDMPVKTTSGKPVLEFIPHLGGAEFTTHCDVSRSPYGCANCRNCIEICPAGAIKESPEEFQLSLCIEKLKEFKKQKNLAQMICGLCLKVCRGEPFAERSEAYFGL